MSGSVNKVILIGNLGKDPEIKTFQNGGKIATFSIATSERWKDRTSGEQREKTEWHNISINSEGLVGVAERFLRKGSKVYVEGKLQTRKWQDQNGNDKYTTEVVLSGLSSVLTMLDGKPGGGQSGGGSGGGYGGQSDGGSNDGWGAGSGGGAPARSGGSGGGSPFDTDLDDEVPF